MILLTLNVVLTGRAMVNSAKFVSKDKTVTNGVIHVIDKVLQGNGSSRLNLDVATVFVPIFCYLILFLSYKF